MKVLLISFEYPPFGGGAGIVASQNYGALKDEGAEVEVLCKNAINDKDFRKLNPFKMLSISLNHKNLNYDVILLNDIRAIHYAGVFFSKGLLKKSVAFLHGSEPEGVYEAPTLKKKITGFKYFYNRAIKNCRKLVAPSFFMKDKFLSRVGVNMSPERIHVCYAGISENFSKEVSRKESRSNLGYSDSDIILLSVSRVVKNKGYQRKLRIFRRLLGKWPNLRWVIVGEGDYLHRLKEEVIQDNLINNVMFTGYVDRSELPKYYSAADIFWLLSEFEESFGLVYLEAQSCGLFSIGKDQFGVRESIDQTNSGALVTSDHEIFEIISNKTYADIDRVKLDSFIKKFTNDNIYHFLQHEIT